VRRNAARSGDAFIVNLVITNALVVTCDAAGTVIPDGTVAVKGGRIAAVGPAAEIGPTAGEVVDAGGRLLMPGLINTHCHAGDSLFRGLVEDLPLEPWLKTVWTAEAATLAPETARLGATLGLAELLLGGVTTTMDMFWYPWETVAAARTLGCRISTGGMFFDGPGPGMDHQGSEARPAMAEAFFEEFAGADDVLPGVFPHGAYTVGPQGLRVARSITDRHGGLFSIHAAETLAEKAQVSARHGTSVIRHLDGLGLLDDRAVLAHCVHIDAGEIEILARTGATVSHNPMSNLKLASGIAPVPDLLAAGVRVTLGTDGPISGNDLDLWLAMRLAATLHRGVGGDATAVSTTQALAMAMREGAAALGAADRIGSLEAGKLADMILIDVARPHAVPLFDAPTHLVFSCAAADVRDVFVGGRQVVRDRVVLGLDLASLLDEVSVLAPRIAASVGR